MIVGFILIILNIGRKIMETKFKELTIGKSEEETKIQKAMIFARNFALFCHPSPFFLNMRFPYKNTNMENPTLSK
jgi:hypothetical protein